MSGRRITELATASTVARTDLVPIVDMSGTPTTRRATLDLLAGLGYRWEINARTASYTLSPSDAGKAVEMNVATGNTLTVPPESTGLWTVGDTIVVQQLGAGTTTLDEGTGVVIDSPATLDLAGPGALAWLRYRGSDAWIVNGDLTPPPGFLTSIVETDDYTLALSDSGGVVEMDKATPVDVTVPANATVDFPVGSIVEVAQVGAGQVTIVAAVGVTIRTPETLLLRTQWSTVSLRKRAADEWILTGDVESL